MKVHELIAELQNFPMDLDVICLGERSDWIFDEDEGCSYEDISTEDRKVSRVQEWVFNKNRVVRVS